MTTILALSSVGGHPFVTAAAGTESGHRSYSVPAAAIIGPIWLPPNTSVQACHSARADYCSAALRGCFALIFIL